MKKIFIISKEYVKEYEMSKILNLIDHYKIENGLFKIIHDYALILNYKPEGDDSEIVEILDVIENWHVPISEIIEECLCCGLTEKEKINDNEYKLIINDVEYRIYK